MSCKHGNHEDACDICDEVTAAYESGLAARLAAPAVANAAPVQMIGEDYIHTIASECSMYEQHDNAKPSADTVIGFADALYKAIMSNAAIHADASFEDAQSSAWGKYVKLWN